MKIAVPSLFALVVGCALAAPAPAQTMPEGGMMMKEGMMTVVMPDGRMSTMSAADKTMSDTMMRGGAMTTPHMMMMSGGKMYMMEDKRMPDGKMMSEHMMMMGK